MDKKELGKRLETLRVNCNITQARIAEYLGVEQSTVSKIEKGERSIGMNKLEKLADLYCTSLEDILSPGEFDNNYNVAFRTKSLTEDEMVILAKINRIILNQRQMESILGQEK